MPVRARRSVRNRLVFPAFAPYVVACGHVPTEGCRGQAVRCANTEPLPQNRLRRSGARLEVTPRGLELSVDQAGAITYGRYRRVHRRAYRRAYRSAYYWGAPSYYYVAPSYYYGARSYYGAPYSYGGPSYFGRRYWW